MAGGWKSMTRCREDQRGFALVAVLSVLVVLTVLGGLLLHIVTKETRLGALRRLGAQSLYLAEAGGYAARAGLMVLTNEDPQGQVALAGTVTQSQLNTWYAGGAAGSQNPLALFDNLILDGQQYNFNPGTTTQWIKFEVNWGVADAHRKLQSAGSGTSTCPATPSELAAMVGTPPTNALGQGLYRSTLVVCKRQAGTPLRYIQALGANTYEFYYSYAIISDGEVDPQSRRRVVLSGTFSLRVRPESFAQFSLFTHVHTTPSGGAIWFTSRTSFDGPVHTNGEFRFAFFPKFGQPDESGPCNPADIVATPLTSVSTYAWFNNLGNPVRRQANENAPGGVRRDAPVLPDCTPASTNDDNDNPAANFTRGVAPITVPSDTYNQKAISIGWNPVDTATPTGWTSSQWNQQIRQVIPELADNTNTVPNAIYIPVVDADGDGVSDAGEALAGGIYVQGSLTSLTLSTAGGGNLAVYTLVQGSQTVTVTVDRANQQTTVSNTCWNPSTCTQSGTRTFSGVPKGWQGGGPAVGANDMIIYVEGDVGTTSTGLSGTLEEKEQATLAASGTIYIRDHLRYEDPPDVLDPNDNPLNVLGLFSATRDIEILSEAPDDLVINAVLMAGRPGISDGYNSSVWVENYNSGSPQGDVHLIGGLIEEYYGAFGQFDPTTGSPVHGYGRDFRYDRRLSRGIQPPYFPNMSRFGIGDGNQRVAGVRPIWREQAP